VLSFLIFNDSCQPIYLNIYRTDLLICRVWLLAVDDQCEINFSIPPIFVGFIHRTKFR